MKERKGISRRTFVIGAAVAGTAVAGSSLLAACKASRRNNFQFYVNEPAYIDPYNLQESEGTKVGSQLFDSLLDYDYKTEKLVPAAAESWTVSPDATVFTFKLREGATFHNGDPVTAADFKRGWERICNPNVSADPSEISYHLAQVKGYKEMFEDGTATELSGVKAIDELTFEVTLSEPYGDFIYVITHPALAPVPAAADDFDSFIDAPIGNGPFMMEGKWVHDQYIRTKRFEGYYGDVPIVEGVDFNIISEVDTAFQEFKAGNLDFARIADGQIDICIEEYGEAGDGYTAQPGKQVMIGPESSTYYIIMNNKDPQLKNVKLREAISYAINRQAICDTVFMGTRNPADGLIPPGIAGYRQGAWKTAVYDVDKAKAALAEAGYPGGQGLANIKLSYNTGGSHEAIMQLIAGDLKAIGIETTLDSMEWAAYLDALAAGTIQMGRLGWIADYPIMENFLFSLFYTNNGDNYSFYSNPDVDKQIMSSRGITNDAERIRSFQAVDDIIQESTPIAPIMFYKHADITSSRVNDFYYAPNLIADLAHTWLTLE